MSSRCSARGAREPSGQGRVDVNRIARVILVSGLAVALAGCRSTWLRPRAAGLTARCEGRCEVEDPETPACEELVRRGPLLPRAGAWLCRFAARPRHVADCAGQCDAPGYSRFHPVPTRPVFAPPGAEWCAGVDVEAQEPPRTNPHPAPRPEEVPTPSADPSLPSAGTGPRRLVGGGRSRGGASWMFTPPGRLPTGHASDAGPRTAFTAQRIR